MSSYISKGSAQNKTIVITANQTQKWNWSNTENINSDFTHKMICFDFAYLTVIFSLSDKNTNILCVSQDKNLDSSVKIELSKHTTI